ncbi:13570_t:CDS:1 [Entrophospora sp. SA101]|nr:13570_t:CDS:1 [Entrophospora sp. SA101]
MSTIPRNGALNPKIFDDELIMKHLNDRFITNFGISYWMETNHPMIDMVTNYLASLSDSPVEIIHCIIRRRTAKFFIPQQPQKEARFIFQRPEDNTFRQHLTVFITINTTIKTNLKNEDIVIGIVVQKVHHGVISLITLVLAQINK